METRGTRIVILMNLFGMFSAELHNKDSPGQTHSSGVLLSCEVSINDRSCRHLNFKMNTLPNNLLQCRADGREHKMRFKIKQIR